MSLEPCSICGVPETLAHRTAHEMGLLQESREDVLRGYIKVVLDRAPPALADYRSGKLTALNALLGLVMRESKGAGNPIMIKKLLEEWPWQL